MHTKAIFKNKVLFSNGDFTEGFQISWKKEEKETGWFELPSFFPIVKESVKTGKFKSWKIVDDHDKSYNLSKEECEAVVRSYLDEVFGHIQGLDGKEQVKLLKDKHISDLLLVPLTKHQIKELKKAGY